MINNRPPRLTPGLLKATKPGIITRFLYFNFYLAFLTLWTSEGARTILEIMLICLSIRLTAGTTFALTVFLSSCTSFNNKSNFSESVTFATLLPIGLILFY